MQPSAAVPSPREPVGPIRALLGTFLLTFAGARTIPRRLPPESEIHDRPTRRRWRLTPLALAAGAAFVVVGLVGLRRYGENFWLYRGFSPPHDPAFVSQQGTEQKIFVRSAALGGRRQEVYVYLPPGYATSTRRYPVFYLLHGVPGRPAAFLLTVRMGVVEDTLVAEHRGRPVILVMPFGSTGTFTDEEWANGIQPNSAWETFVSRDVVKAIDARYRTIASARGRALGGLSEGGYGSLNIGLHHPGEFGVLESWLGYEKADDLPGIFGRRPQRLAYNSPLVQLKAVAPALRRQHTYIWFYSGSNDPLRKQNAAFAGELTRLGVSHRYFLADGGHNWLPVRNQATPAYEAAAARLTHG